MSSSYDSAVVDTAMVDDPRQLMVPRGVRLLFLEALVWAKVRRTDGFIPTGALAKLTDEPDPEQGATQLITVGLWESKPLGWQIVDFADTQMTAARVKEIKAAARERYDRYRTKKAASEPEEDKRVSNAATNGAARPPAPPARKGGGQKEGDGSPLGLEAVATVSEDPHPQTEAPTRRELARIIREAPNDMLRNRYRKVFDGAFGHLYERAAA